MSAHKANDMSIVLSSDTESLNSVDNYQNVDLNSSDNSDNSPNSLDNTERPGISSHNSSPTPLIQNESKHLDQKENHLKRRDKKVHFNLDNTRTKKQKHDDCDDNADDRCHNISDGNGDDNSDDSFDDNTNDKDDSLEFRNDNSGNDERSIKTMPFSIKEDLEDGHYDNQGNFIWNERDHDAHLDACLDGWSAKDIEKARIAQSRSESRSKSDLSETNTDQEKVSHLVAQLCSVLEQADTFIHENNDKTSRSQIKAKVNLLDQPLQHVFNLVSHNRSLILQLTDLSTRLSIDYGMDDLYSMSGSDLEDLKHSLKNKDRHDEYFYQWTDDLTKKVYGPFTLDTMRQWVEGGFFSGKRRAMFKTGGDNQFKSLREIPDLID